MASPLDFIGAFSTDPNNVLYQLFLPFLLISALFFGALEVIHAFKKRTSMVLAILFSLFAFPIYPFFATWLSLLGSFAALAMFLGLFVFYTAVYAFRKNKTLWFQTMSDVDKLKKIEERIQRENKKFAQAHERGNVGKSRAIDEYIRSLERERDYLRRKISSGEHL
jgi:hypothetical protein